MDELKPCPFCGCEEVLADDNFLRGWVVLCTACETEGPWDLGRSGAIEKWNQRANEVPCDACEQLRVRLAGCAVAALGGISGDQLAHIGDYGWSAAYQDVVELRKLYDKLVGELENMRGTTDD